MVHHDGGSTVVITIVRITISGKHQGSATGYAGVRKIMQRVRELAGEEHSGAPVKIVYCLVYPEDNTRNVRKVPAGWNEDTAGGDDHRGSAFCLRVPTSVSTGSGFQFS